MTQHSRAVLSGMGWLVCATLVSLSVGAEPERSGAILVKSRSVGEVKGRVVTSREVAMAWAFELILLMETAANWAPEQEKRMLGEFSERLAKPAEPETTMMVLDWWAAEKEARDLSVTGPVSMEIENWTSKVQNYWKSRPEWRAIEASAPEIKSVVERRLYAQALESVRGSTALLSISDADALQYYKAHPDKYGGRPFPQFQSEIRKELEEKQRKRRMDDWRTILRQKHKVKSYVG